jgi:GT2 family glycosyltransferase
MQSNPDIGIMSGVMTDRNGKNVPSEYGITTSYKKALIECFYLYRHYQMHYAKNKIDYSKTIMYVEVVWGSLFIISRKAYEKINGFDEGTFLYHEENIISERMKNAGYKEAILTREQFVHKHAVSISKGTSRMSRHKMGMKSQYYFQTRYHNISSFQKRLLKAMMSYSVFELHCVNGVLSLIGK